MITLLGPTSRPLSSFSWARTAWHEFAHVVTLQQSKGQVPRWLTEGLSVYEEKARRSNWSREMERQLFDRYHNDRLLRMDAINRAFRGGDIMFAYYQGGLIAEHLTKTRGFDVIPKMLRAFARGPYDGRGLQGRARAGPRGLRPPVQGVRGGDRRRLRDGARGGTGRPSTRSRSA